MYHQTASEKAKLEKEEIAKTSLKNGLEYLNFLNMFFDHKKNHHEQMKIFVNFILNNFKLIQNITN
jgi:hypothetical protein